MSDTVAGLLVRAMESFERYEDEAVLLRLLESWRESRAERIAWLAERLTGLVACKPDLMPEGPLGEPGRLERLLFPEVESPRILRLLRNRLEPLLGEPVDPRFTGSLLALAALPRAEQEEVFLPLCELFLHRKDPRALEPLRALRERLPPSSPYARQLDLTLQRMEAEARPLSAAASARCEALEGAMARREQAVVLGAPLRDELLTHVGAHPNDDGARLVLADHLLEHGDPLGEFIALQCQPEPGEAPGARLLNLHYGRWEALLGPGVEPQWTRFKRGLPVAVRLRLTPGQPQPPPGPFWCAVRELDCYLAGDELQADWFAHPNLRNVTVLLHVPLRLAARLGAHPLPVRKLVMVGDVIHEAPGVFNSLASLPHLTWLEVLGASPADVHLCASSPLARRLESYVVLEGGLWRLLGEPAAKVPVEVRLRSALNLEALAEALRAAVGFGTQALRIHSEYRLHADIVSRLESAASAYQRIEWNLPPG